jgi:hypothetical protein
MRNPLFLLCLVLLGCSSFQGSVSNHRDIASLKNQAFSEISLTLSQDVIFANGANTVTLKVETKNPEIKAEDLKLVTDVSIDSGQFSGSSGSFQVQIKPKVKSPSLKLLVMWKDQLSPIIELKTTLKPLTDKMLPLKTVSNTTNWVSGLYYQRQDLLSAGQFEAFSIDNQGKNTIVSANESAREFAFSFDEQARQNISLMISDAPNGTVSHTMHSHFMFFPRKYLPFAELDKKQVTVTLPTGEQIFFSETGEIIDGVFEEGPVDVGPDRFKRTYADFRYNGKGILLRANARGQMPQQGQFEAAKIDMEFGLKNSADVLIINGTTGQRCRRPKIDFWTAEDVSPILFKFPTDQEFDTYLKAKCNFGIPEMEDLPASNEVENSAQLSQDLWNQCQVSADIKNCLSEKTDQISNQETQSKVRFALEILYSQAKQVEKNQIASLLDKEVKSIRLALLSEASWVDKLSCLEKAKTLLKVSFKFHSALELIRPELIQTCSSINEEMQNIATFEIATFKDKLEANFDWAASSTIEQFASDCQKQGLSFMTSAQRYAQTPNIYHPSLKFICTQIESTQVYQNWLKTQATSVEQTLSNELMIKLEVQGEELAKSCLKDFPVDSQLNRLRFKTKRDSCLTEKWSSLEVALINEAKQTPLVRKLNLSLDALNTRLSLERRKLQLKIMKKYFL